VLTYQTNLSPEKVCLSVTNQRVLIPEHAIFGPPFRLHNFLRPHLFQNSQSKNTTYAATRRVSIFAGVIWSTELPPGC